MPRFTVMEKSDEKTRQNPHSGHRARMRERYRRYGEEGLSKHEMLEIMLYGSHSRRNTNPIAHELLDKFGSISGVLNADVSQLMNVKGVGEETAVRLKTYLGAHRIMLAEESVEKKRLRTYREAEKYTRDKLKGSAREEFIIICQDNGYRILGERKWSGSAGRVSVGVREIVEYAMSLNATAVIASHSHPNGSASPSPSDMMFTKTLYGALKGVDITLLEHIIHGETEAYSFAGSGEMSKYREEYMAEYMPGVAVEEQTLE